LEEVVGRDRRTVITTRGPVTLRSELVPSTLNYLLRTGADPARVEALAQALSEDHSLEDNLYRLCDSNSGEISVDVLEQAVAFFRTHPTWWEQAVESRFEVQTEALRAQIQDKWDLAEFDIGVGIAKGGYQFVKGTVVGLYDLMLLAYSLCTSGEGWAQAGEMLKTAAVFFAKVQYGGAKQREEAIAGAKQFAQKLVDHISQSIAEQWDKACAEGREKELAAKWATQGVLEVATVVLAVMKGVRAASVAREAGEASSLAGKTREVQSLTKAAIALEAGVRPSIALGRRLFPGRSEQFYKSFAKIQGTVLGAYDRYSVGELPDRLAATFSGSRYVEIRLDKPLRAYRVWAPETTAGDMGGFWGLVKPKGSLPAKIDQALLPEWGYLLRDKRLRSQATRVVGRELVAGQTVMVGETGFQGGIWHGGSVQVLIDPSLKQGRIFHRGVLK
jgi:hypothetical protein